MRTAPSALGVLLGLALAVYGLASLTGGWLGFPARYEVKAPASVAADGADGRLEFEAVVRDGGEALGVGLLLAGVGLATVSAWPRRRQDGA